MFPNAFWIFINQIFKAFEIHFGKVNECFLNIPYSSSLLWISHIQLVFIIPFIFKGNWFITQWNIKLLFAPFKIQKRFLRISNRLFEHEDILRSRVKRWPFSHPLLKPYVRISRIRLSFGLSLCRRWIIQQRWKRNQTVDSTFSLLSPSVLVYSAVVSPSSH